MRKRLLGSLAASAVLFADAQTAASDAAPPEADCRQASNDCVAQGRWNFSLSLGGGVRTNPLLQGRDIPLVVIPQFSYYGRRFFIDNLDLGLTLAESDSNSLSLVASPGYDRVFFYRSELQNIFVSGFAGAGAPPRIVPPDTPGAVQFPPRPRRITYLSGPEWTFKYRGITGQLDLLHEITGQNRGNEIRAALRIPLVESQVSLAANIGVTWKSAAIVNYYYGEPNFYQAGAALDPFIKLKFALPLGGKWQFNAFVEYEQMGKGIANSPIVTEDHVVTCFIGATYTH